MPAVRQVAPLNRMVVAGPIRPAESAPEGGPAESAVATRSPERRPAAARPAEVLSFS